MPESSRIFVVEDDLATRQSLVLVFCGMGYDVEAASCGLDAIERLSLEGGQPGFDVVLSDISLGDTDGIAVLKAARASSARPEVILMTGYSTVQTAVEALRFGAFDYLFKPYDVPGLLDAVGRAVAHRRAEVERDRALQTIRASLLTLQSLEHGHAPAPNATVAPPPPRDGRFISLGQLLIDLFTRTATYGGHPLRLTPTEFSLLLCLGEQPGRVHSYQELVHRVYGHSVDDRQARALLKGHVHNLRAKLSPALIQAARGVGYMLAPPFE